jgi:ABC-type sugar transport system ATPase subunit
MEATAAPPGETAIPLIEMRRIAKYFGAVAALRGVDFAVRRGEVVALLGDNGAGKSTLIKILAGVLAPDDGQILVDGHPTDISGPKDAKALGIQTVYQDLALCDNLDVSANIFLGRELRKQWLGGWVGWFDRRAMATETRALLDRLRIEIDDLGSIVRHLSGGQRQSVAIAKSVYGNARVVIMDEPTAALGVAQTAKVLALVGDLRAAGLAVVYISHNMADVFEVADRMVVLKNGRLVGERRRDNTDRDEIVRLIIAGEPAPVREAAA